MSICRSPTWPLLALLLLGAWLPAGAGNLVNPWFEVPGPLDGPPRIIGGYTGGCLQGAVDLAAYEGDRFQLMRMSRKRHFAHPRMRQFIERLASEVQARGFGKLLVGDQSQARGGPATTGHASHQIGLDGDFWFWLDSPATERRLSPDEVENLSAISMLNPDKDAVDPARFTDKQVELLKFAVAQPGVERIFVHPAIKRALCEQTGQASWLNRIRPWWGHHYHFHVRLGCPDGQKECRSQEPPPDDPECGSELDWWFSEEAAEKLRKSIAASEKLTPAERLQKKLAKVPAECGVFLD